MIEIFVSAGVGAAIASAGFLIQNRLSRRARKLEARRSWVAAFKDSGLIKELEYLSDVPSTSSLDHFLQLIPEPPTAIDLEFNGEFNAVRMTVRKQVASLYDLRVTENSKGQYFSERLDNSIEDFDARLSRWANGRLFSNALKRPLTR